MKKLKGMSTKQKVQYIWDYYKIHIGGAILIFSIAFSLIYGQITKVDYIFNTTIISSGLTEDVRIDFEDKLNDVLIDENSKNEKAQVSYIPINNPDDSGLELIMKFISKLTAKEVDIIIADESQMDGLVEDGAFLELSNIKYLDGTDNDYYLSSIDNKIYGICLEDSPVLNAINYNTKGKILAISSTSLNINDAAKVIKLLIK